MEDGINLYMLLTVFALIFSESKSLNLISEKLNEKLKRTIYSFSGGFTASLRTPITVCKQSAKIPKQMLNEAISEYSLNKKYRGKKPPQFLLIKYKTARRTN